MGRWFLKLPGFTLKIDYDYKGKYLMTLERWRFFVQAILSFDTYKSQVTVYFWG